MKATDFLKERMQENTFTDQDLVASAQKHMGKMLQTGSGHANAVATIADMLQTKGIEPNRAANAAKQAFANLTGGQKIAE